MSTGGKATAMHDYDLAIIDGRVGRRHGRISIRQYDGAVE